MFTLDIPKYSQYLYLRLLKSGFNVFTFIILRDEHMADM